VSEDARLFQAAADRTARRAREDLPVADAPRLDALVLVGRYVAGDLSLPEFEERRDAVARRSADPTLGLQVEALCRGVDAVRSGDRPADERSRRYRSLARWTLDPLAERVGLPDDRPAELDVPLVRDERSGDPALVDRHRLRHAVDDGRPGYDLLPEEPSAVREAVERIHEETATGVPFLAPAESRYAAGVDAAAAFARAAGTDDPAPGTLGDVEAAAAEPLDGAAPALRRLLARAAVAAEALDEDAMRSHPVEAAAATFAGAVGADGPTGTGLPAETVDDALRDRLDDPGPVAAAGAAALDDLDRPVSARLSAVDRAAADLDDDPDRDAGDGPGRDR
jgi:hypothetical protein